MYFIHLCIIYVFHWNINSMITMTQSVLFIATSLAIRFDTQNRAWYIEGVQAQIRTNLYKNIRTAYLSPLPVTHTHTHTHTHECTSLSLALYSSYTLLMQAPYSFQCLLSLTYTTGWGPWLVGRGEGAHTHTHTHVHGDTHTQNVILLSHKKRVKPCHV